MVLNFKPLTQTIFNYIGLDLFLNTGIKFFKIGSSGRPATDILIFYGPLAE